MGLFRIYTSREKEKDLTQYYDKSPYTSRNVKRASDNINNATKKFYNTAIADRLMTVSWSNYIIQHLYIKHRAYSASIHQAPGLFSIYTSSTGLIQHIYIKHRTYSAFIHQAPDLFSIYTSSTGLIQHIYIKHRTYSAFIHQAPDLFSIYTSSTGLIQHLYIKHRAYSASIHQASGLFSIYTSSIGLIQLQPVRHDFCLLRLDCWFLLFISPEPKAQNELL